MTGRNSFGKRQRQAIALAVLSLGMLCSRPLLALDFDALEGAAGHKFVPLTHLTQEQGQRFLSRLKLGAASPMPGTNALLVTAGPEELRKAIAVLDVVDSPDQYDIKQLGMASAVAGLPSNEQIEAAVGSLSIGSFSKRPPQGNKPRALVDTHNGVIVAIAPIFQLQDIALAVELGPEILKRRRENAERTVIPPTVQTRVMLESSFSPQTSDLSGSANAPLRQEVLKRVQEIRLSDQAASPSAEMSRPETAAPRLFGPSGNPLSQGLAPMPAGSDTPVPPVPARFAQLSAESSGALEEIATLQPGQMVPVEEGTLMPARAVSALDENRRAATGARVQSVPDVGAYEPNQLLDDDRVVTMQLPETLPVIHLLDLVAKYTNLTYLYDPSQVTGDVTLKLNGDLQGTMKVRDLYLLLESVLKFRGLAMTRHKDNVVTIVPVGSALDIDPQLVGPGQPTLRAGDVVVTRVFELRYIDAASAKNLLDGMKLSIDVTPIADRGTLIVTAYAYRMARIEQLLLMVDKPGDPRKFKYRQLKYTMARGLGEKVKALAEQLESVVVTVAAPSPETTSPQLPGETAAAYQARLARLRALATTRTTTTPARPGELPTKPGVYLDADERTNRILMIGLEEQLAVVDDLVDALDVQQQDLRALKLYRLEFVDAEEVNKKLVELGIISPPIDTSMMSSRITRTGTPAATSSAAAAAAARAATAAATQAQTAALMTEVTEEGPVEQPQVVVIESTNALLVNATAEQHAQIQTIIGYVDSEMLATEIPYKIYPLENSSPAHLAQVLESLILDTTENQDPEGKVQTVVRRQEQIKIVPDPNTYSLVVYASKKNQDWISNLVKQLDKRRPQVLIDVTLVEITKTDAFNYDLNIIQSLPDLTATSGLTGVIAGNITSGTILDKLSQSGRSQFADAQWNGDQFTGFYGDKHINALLTAMQSKNYGRVLAKPKILVNDNQPGIIKTVDTTYVQKTSSIPVSSGGAGQDATLIQTAVDYTPYEAGLELNITPHISEGDLLRLDVSLVRSDFKPTGSADKPPNTTASEISTAVTVPDGSTIILGGLIRLNQNKGGKKVPLLGDLPFLGGLFRSTNNSDDQSKLYVFVKAEVIRPDENAAHGRDELERLSERNRLAFEKHEAEFQMHQNWPAIKPTPVDPSRVLDAQ
jgi:type II secretory pathway component GspD/PulD (secretin)